jgi:phosphatidate cytidylyltransferase
MHRLRVLSALLLIPPFLLLVHFGSPFHFSLLVAIAILLCGWEFAWLCPVGGSRGLAGLIILGSLAWHGAIVWEANSALLPPIVATLVVLVLVRTLVAGVDLRAGVTQAAWTLLGVAYVGGLLSFGSLLRDGWAGRQFIYFLTFTTWVGDASAYYVGSRWGHRPLAPRVSPKKTLEGALGGIAGTALVAALGSDWIWPRLPIGKAIWVGVLLSVVGMLGDLAESAVKRAAGVKDSGAMIPGHGGVLDRLDSLIFAAPFLYALVRMGWV